MHQTARDLQPPAHPARVGRDQVLSPIGERHEVEQVHGAFAALAPRQAIKLAIDVEVFPSGQVEVGGQCLRDDADRLAHGMRVLGDVITRHYRTPRSRRQQRGEHADQRGLARAVGTEQAKSLAVAHLEGHRVDGDERAEAFSQRFGVDCC